AHDRERRPVLTAFATIAPLGWSVFVEQPLGEAFAPLYASAIRTVILLLLGVALAVVASLFLARRMVTPVQTLQAGAARIGAGELGHRIELKPGGQRQRLSRAWVTGRAVLDGQAVHVADLTQVSDAEYPEGKAMALRFGHRATLATPLMREGTAIGAILVRRREPRPFSEKQITLLKTFADQAVIAIENVRLFQELEARTRDLVRSVDELKALGEVSRAVSSTLN